jgi:peptide-methionine (S)-S-oxide reductase
LGDHIETIQIDYDPMRISYHELLEIFWKSHNPTRRPWSPQYMSVIFYHNQEQKNLAIKTSDRETARLVNKIYTEIAPAEKFYPAEDYHQKYRLRQERDIMREFNAMYPNFNDLVNSTAAARANGYLGGHGSLLTLKKDLDKMGLSRESGQKLMGFVKAYNN